MDYLEFANLPMMWVVSAPIVLIALIQALVYLKRAYSAALEIGFDRDMLNRCIRSSIITSIGPSCAIGVGIVGLMKLIGGPMAWQRLSVIGALIFEVPNVAFAAEGLGLTLHEITPMAFAAICWAMGLSGIFWQLNVIFFAPSYDKILHKVTKGDEKILSFIVLSTMMAIFSRNIIPNFLVISRSTFATIIGAGVMVIMTLLCKKLKQDWIAEWTLPVSMLVGMFGALAF